LHQKTTRGKEKDREKEKKTREKELCPKTEGAKRVERKKTSRGKKKEDERKGQKSSFERRESFDKGGWRILQEKGTKKAREGWKKKPAPCRRKERGNAPQGGGGLQSKRKRRGPPVGISRSQKERERRTREGNEWWFYTRKKGCK